MIRLPAVAGRFYPSDPEELSRQLRHFLEVPGSTEKMRAKACLVPHAGYKYSGHVAGAVYGRLQLTKTLLIVGPRHCPPGGPLAIFSDGRWRTPLGEAQIESHLAADLKRACPLLAEDSVAHRNEHSLEVQLPFLQHLVPDVRFVPVALGTVRLRELEQLGRAIAEVLAARSEEVLLVATSDMNHYEDDKTTRVKDRKALDKVLALDPRGLYDVVSRESISMCGFGPVVTMLTAARELGATEAELVRYATSGDVTEDRDEVVGYAGVIVH